MSITYEAAFWDEDQLQQEIAGRLPVGWALDLHANDLVNRWEASILNGAGEVIWGGVAITSQLVLFEALGWIETRDIPLSDSSPWVRRRGELNSQRVHEHVQSLFPHIEDPPDLDPSQVEELYKTVI